MNQYARRLHSKFNKKPLQNKLFNYLFPLTEIVQPKPDVYLAVEIKLRLLNEMLAVQILIWR